MNRINSIHAAAMWVVLSALAAPVFAKLPVPSPEAKAKATEAAAKTAWSDKVGAYKLCLAGDRTAAAYRSRAKAAGGAVPPAVATPPCVEPGPYVTTVVTPTPPLEAAGAHSPPATAVAPPSAKATAGELQGHTKK